MPEVNQTILIDLEIDEVIDNALTGTKLENVPTDDDYLITLLATADAFDIEHELEADTDTLVQPSVIGDTLRNPVQPDDLVGRFMVTGGSKMFYKIEGGASAGQVIAKFIYTPASML